MAGEGAYNNMRALKIAGALNRLLPLPLKYD